MREDIINSDHEEKKTLDALWSQAVIARDKHCMICGGPADYALHSIVPRTDNKTRWSLLNGITVCRKCHVFIQCGKLKDKAMLAIWKIVTDDYIRLQGQDPGSIHTRWLEEQLIYLIKKLKEYKNVHCNNK